MKITFVLPHTGLSGGIRVISIYADRLARRGHQVTVVSTPLAQPSLRERARSIVRTRRLVSEPRQTYTYFDSLGVDHRVIDRARPITDADVPDADVVVATWWETAEWVAALSPAKGAKAYFIQGYEVFPHQPADRVKATWRLPMHKITISRWLVELARDKFGDDAVSLVPNAVDHEQFTAPPRGKQPAPAVGMLYSTASFKGADVSLRAFEIAARAVPELRLVGFGLERPSAELPLPKDAAYVCKPPQDAIPGIYASCDAWLFGSRSEGFGLPLLEAMACRTPVIATPAGAAPEIVAGGGGMLVRHDDPEAMAAEIERVAAMSDASWRELSDAACRNAASYSWDGAAAKFEEALETARRRGLGRTHPFPGARLSA